MCCVQGMSKVDTCQMSICVVCAGDARREGRSRDGTHHCARGCITPRTLPPETRNPSTKGTPLKVLRTFTRKPRPKSSRECLVCAMFARQRHACAPRRARRRSDARHCARGCITPRMPETRTPVPAAAHQGNNSKGSQDFCLKVKAKNWP